MTPQPSPVKKPLSTPAACVLLLLLSACADGSSPTQPSVAAPAAQRISLEGEPGSGDGHVLERARASGGRTIHLGPGERRQWVFAVHAQEAAYSIAMTYSNGEEGELETISVHIDGVLARSFQDRNTGDASEGWNTFVSDPVGAVTLKSGSHTIVLEVAGGDGCVEVDLVTLSPAIELTSSAPPSS